MPRRKGRKDPTQPDALRAYDRRGNVRPADDRYLNAEQRDAKAVYVEESTPDEVKEAQAIAASVESSGAAAQVTPVTSARADEKEKTNG